MSDKMIDSDITRRGEFVYFFSITMGNPNGDPGNGNMPRTVENTEIGLVTDVCNKRKVRDYVSIAKGGDPGYKIYVSQAAILGNTQSEAYTACGISGKKTANADEMRKVQGWMCKNFWDVRTFGAVMNLANYGCGEVRGPVQFTHSLSLDPIQIQELQITRVAVANQEKADAQKDGGNRAMGVKYAVPYAMYRMHGFVVPAFAEKTGLAEKDLDLLWEALLNMHSIDHSASRAEMHACGLYVFRHFSKLGNAKSQDLFKLVTAQRLTDDGVPPTSDKDYEIKADFGRVPDKVELTQVL